MTRRLRIGRMPRWQRRTTYVVLGACAASGIVWFAALDALHASTSAARPWWILHGVTAALATASIGGALAQHVVVTWKSWRGRWSGGVNLALLAALVGSALYLMYGNEEGHDVAHWMHIGIGLAAIFAFAWHVLRGRTRVPRLPHREPRA